MVEHRRAELRADGRRIIGVVMRYGRTAMVRDPAGVAVQESFRRGAFSGYLQRHGPTTLNLQHDSSIEIARTGDPGRLGALRLHDSADELRMVATLPTGAAFDAALALVADGSTAETSVEFIATAEQRDGDQRTVTAAELPAIGVVQSAAYGAAGRVEVRRGGTVLQGKIPYRKRLACECSGKDCSFAEFAPGSLELGPEVLAVAGDYSRPLASMRRGSLVLEHGPDALSVEIALQDAETARELLAAAEIAGGVYLRPFIDRARAKFERVNDLAKYSSAPVRAIVASVTDRVEGWDPAVIREPRSADPPRRRRRVWL